LVNILIDIWREIRERSIMREISNVISNNNVCAVLSFTWKCLLSRVYAKFREMLNFEGLITSNHKCEIMALLPIREAGLLTPKCRRLWFRYTPRETTPSFECADFHQIAIPSDGLLTKKNGKYANPWNSLTLRSH